MIKRLISFQWLRWFGGDSIKKQSKQELEKIYGGFSAWVGIGISALVVFLSGVLEGITNPDKCRGWKNVSYVN